MISLSQLGEKIANKFGDKKDYGVGTSSIFKNFNKITEFKPFEHLLPYSAYDNNRKLFINDSSVGFGLELMPLLGASDDEVSRIVSMLNDKLANNGDLHIQLFVTNKIGDTLERFKKARYYHGISKELNARLVNERINYYIKSTKESINKAYPFYLKDHKLFLYYSEPLDEALDIKLNRLDDIREVFKTTLSAITSVLDIDIKLFIKYLKEILNPSLDVNWHNSDYNKYMRISEQLVSTDTAFDIKDNRIELGFNKTSSKIEDSQKAVIQCFNLEELPNEAAVWQSSDNIGKLLEPAMQLSCPIIININLRAVDKTEGRNKAQAQFMLNDNKAHSPLARIMPSVSKKHSEWTHLRELLDDGERLVKLSYQVTAISQKNNYKKDAIKLRDLFQSNGWDLRLDTYFQLPSFMQNLPFMATEGLYQDLKYFSRLKTMTMFNAVNIMPLLSDYKGLNNADGLMFAGRRGQVANFSNFANPDGNYNMAIPAKSRAGKSFLMQEIIFDLLCQNGMARVLDLGRSYEKFCNLVNGQYIEMTEGVCINPFTHVVEINKSLSQIKAIVATMAHPSGDASDKELSFITNAIKHAFDKKQNAATVTDIINELKSINDAVASDLVILLQKYGKGGQYESYFEGKSTIDNTNPFIVLELEELKNKPDLKSVAVLSIMLQITEEFYSLPRNIKKLCVIDEAWDLLHSSKQTAQFIEAGYRRVAKQNGAFATIVQSVNDYFRNEVGIAIFENSDIQIIMAQLDSTIDQLKNNDRLKFSAYEERLLRSFQGTAEYKECLIRTPQGSSVFRVLFDPFTRILYSTKGEEFEAVKGLVNQGMAIEDAVQTVAKKVYKDA